MSPELHGVPGLKSPARPPICVPMKRSHVVPAAPVDVRASDDTFLTPEQVAELIQIPSKTLAAWRSQRKGPLFLRMGAHVRYPKSHLDRWLGECNQEADRWMAS